MKTLRTGEAARRLNVPHRRLYNLLHGRVIPGVEHVDGRWRFQESALPEVARCLRKDDEPRPTQRIYATDSPRDAAFLKFVGHTMRGVRAGLRPDRHEVVFEDPRGDCEADLEMFKSSPMHQFATELEGVYRTLRSGISIR